eukprot:3760828-Pyramimonas_sp.AAC.1
MRFVAFAPDETQVYECGPRPEMHATEPLSGCDSDAALRESATPLRAGRSADYAYNMLHTRLKDRSRQPKSSARPTLEPTSRCRHPAEDVAVPLWWLPSTLKWLPSTLWCPPPTAWRVCRLRRGVRLPPPSADCDFCAGDANADAPRDVPCAEPSGHHAEDDADAHGAL